MAAESLYLGLEIGGTKLQIGLAGATGPILAQTRLKIEPRSGSAGILDQIASSLDPLLRSIQRSRESILAAGVGFGGPVDAARGTILRSHQVSGWESYPIADWVRTRLGIPEVAIQNDADTAALGEVRAGAGVGFSPVLYVTIGSGIGGGLIVEGQIYRGAGLGATEIGHLRVGEGEPRATLEQVASGWSIARAGARLVEDRLAAGDRDTPIVRGAEFDPSRVTGEVVADAARAGDRGALQILDRAQRAMASALAHAVALLAPGRIILGGGVSLIGEALWFDPIREELDRIVFPPFARSYEIVPAALGEDVVIHGALALARDAVQHT